MIPRAALVLVLAIASCDIDDGPSVFDPIRCTEIGCQDGLAIAVERRDQEPFSPGVYDLVLTLSGAEPFPISCTLEGSGDMRCGEAAEDIRIGTDETRTALDIRISEAPPSVAISIAYEGKPIGSEELSPDYQIVTPNGPDCPPTCFQAGVSIAVASTD